MINKPRPQVKPRLRLPGFFSEVIRTVLFIVVVTVLFDMAVPRSLVDGSSMQPTFEDTERLIVSRVHYLAMRPDRGDIVVFNSVNPNEPDVMLIKRVLGMPGETVEFRDQRLYINGVLFDEPYTAETCTEFRCPDSITELGSDEYYVLGDNRNVSQDSRRFGAIPIDNVVGRVVFRYWPLQRIGIIAHQDY
ncbi:MAG: signal peptidase I [Anaerolineae bacterium]